ncbi:unnamed protein product [Gongylonema pulchrum]|uniref:Uncharacterized protein n=1 Tax=Gongylonema pulchrum TaxID=637853 RepID=A0A183D7R0_9BILA|nr:unnamed protein product [Gongylonema pulchrum]
MEKSRCQELKWAQLIQAVDEHLRAIALNASVCHEELRMRYTMSCLHVTRPFDQHRKHDAVGRQKVALTGHAQHVLTGKGKWALTGQIAGGDNINMQVILQTFLNVFIYFCFIYCVRGW